MIFSLSELLKRLMRECKLKQADLVELLGVPLDRVKSLTSGKVKNLTREEGEALIRKLNVRAEWLVTGEGAMFQSDSEQALAQKLDALKSATQRATVPGLTDDESARLGEILFFANQGDAAGIRSALRHAHSSADADTDGTPIDWSAYLHVPHYDVQASAGHGSLVGDESLVDHLVFKRDWVVRGMGLDPKALALIDVRGDSMSPTINDGDLILLDTRETHQVTEGIYAINLAGGLLVKRLRLRLSGAVEVASDNERYGTETISGDQLAQLHIVGRVVWQGRRI